MTNRKFKQFQPEDWVGPVEKVEFWKFDDPHFKGDRYSWVRTEGPYPEMFKWEHFIPRPVAVDEFQLESIREEVLKGGK